MKNGILIAAIIFLFGSQSPFARGDDGAQGGVVRQDVGTLHKAEQQLGQDDAAVAADARAKADAQKRVRDEDDRIAQDIENGDLASARKDEAARKADLQIVNADQAAMRQAQQQVDQQRQTVHQDRQDLHQAIHQQDGTSGPDHHREFNAQERFDQLQKEREMERREVKADDAQIAKDIKDGNLAGAQKEEEKLAKDKHAEHVDRAKQHDLHKDKEKAERERLAREKAAHDKQAHAKQAPPAAKSAEPKKAPAQ